MSGIPSEALQNVLRTAGFEAIAEGEYAIEPRHLLLGILLSDYESTLQILHVTDPKSHIVGLRMATRCVENSSVALCDVAPSDSTRRVLELASAEALALGHSTVDTGHLLLALVTESENVAAEFIHNRGVKAERLRAELGRRTATQPNRVTEHPHYEEPEDLLKVLPRTRRSIASALLQALAQPCVYVAAVESQNARSISYADARGSAVPDARVANSAMSSRHQRFSLTEREAEVLSLIGQGKTTKEISALLSISVGTIGNHRKSLCRKLNVHSSAELVTAAARHLPADFQRYRQSVGMLRRPSRQSRR